MHFSEDDLRAALKRKDPGAGFTQRVMTRINEAEAKAALAPPPRRRLFAQWWPLKLRPVLVSAVTASVLLAGGWLGYQHHQKVEIAKAEEAKDQAILALQITRAKLNHVLQHASYPQRRDAKTRRESL